MEGRNLSAWCATQRRDKRLETAAQFATTTAQYVALVQRNDLAIF